jgi:hypothetical protein
MGYLFFFAQRRILLACCAMGLFVEFWRDADVSASPFLTSYQALKPQSILSLHLACVFTCCRRYPNILSYLWALLPAPRPQTPVTLVCVVSFFQMHRTAVQYHSGKLASLPPACRVQIQATKHEFDPSPSTDQNGEIFIENGCNRAFGAPRNSAV